MREKLLYLILFVLTFNFGFAQTQTITIPWDYFAVPPEDINFGGQSIFDTNITIEVGDTVVWEWVENASGHNVKSVQGESVETFGTPGGEFDTFNHVYSFSHTFTQVGDNKFNCAPHASLMYGTVTVVADGTLGIDGFNLSSFSISPNPAKDNMKINLPIEYGKLTVEVYDVLGKRVHKQDFKSAQNINVNVSSWRVGVYFVRLTDGNKSHTKRFVKN